MTRSLTKAERIRKLTTRARRRILADLATGRIPRCASWRSLAGKTHANGYLLPARGIDPWMPESVRDRISLWSEAIEKLDVWLRAGALRARHSLR